MTDAASMIVRMLFSLAVVLAVIAAIYWAAKRRMSPGARVAGVRRIGVGTGQRAVRAPLQVLARVTCSRATAVTAIQFGEQVLLVGSNDQSVATLLASMTREQWDSQAGVRGTSDTPDIAGPAPRSVVDSLREITVRHV